MRGWAAVVVGFAVGLAGGAWLGTGTRADVFVRAAAGGRYLLDVRLDENALGRMVNIPTATLGEATVTKRSLFFFSTYGFTLRLRPGVAGDAERTIRSLEISARLPGRVTSTNAVRVAGGTATWETLGPDMLVLRTRAVHWIRIVLFGALAGGALAAYRRR